MRCKACEEPLDGPFVTTRRDGEEEYSYVQHDKDKCIHNLLVRIEDLEDLVKRLDRIVMSGLNLDGLR